MGRIRDYLRGSTLERLPAVESLDLVKRDVEPLEGTLISLFDSQIPSWWNEQGLSPASSWVPGNALLAERVWVANRCVQLNAQQIASMPLRFEGVTEPAWVSSPDPNLFPNGIGDAIHAIVKNLYGWGYALLYVTQRYVDGYPRNWTVLDPGQVSITWRNGARVYKYGGGGGEIDPADIVQIDRDPGCGLHGTSAMRAYAQLAWGLLAAGNQSMSVSQGGIPLAVLKSERKLTAAQALEIQTQWMAAVQRRNGAPPVLPPELSFEALSFDPSELALLETQEFDARALATAFGVPSVLLNMALQGGLTYQNPSALGEMWWRFELRPTGKRIADAFSAQMLPRGQWVWLDAADTFLPLTGSPSEEEPQAAVDNEPPAVATASPRLTAIGGSG